MIMPAKRLSKDGYAKLSKKFFASLPNGVYLVSNCYASPPISNFAEYVVPSAEREEQWQRITAAGADQRLCRVFKDQAAYQQWLDEHVHLMFPKK